MKLSEALLELKESNSEELAHKILSCLSNPTQILCEDFCKLTKSTEIKIKFVILSVEAELRFGQRAREALGLPPLTLDYEILTNIRHLEQWEINAFLFHLEFGNILDQESLSTIYKHIDECQECADKVKNNT